MIHNDSASLMRPSEIEAWVLRVIGQIKAGQVDEDSRVELKSEWPETKEKFARQLAGHANAARGEPILWIIGVDQKVGVVGAERRELAEWYPAIASMFDGVAPRVQDVVVPTETVPVMGLLFDTSRVPFVVQNPAYGKQKGESIALEVPWREHTSTRTARRSDLIQILQPIQRRPEVELLGAEAWQTIEHVGPLRDDYAHVWKCDIRLYVTSRTVERLVIPRHRCRCSMEMIGRIARTDAKKIQLVPPSMPREPWMRPFYYDQIDSELEASHTVKATPSEVLIEGAGRLDFRCEVVTPIASPPQGWKDLDLYLQLTPALMDTPIDVHARLRYEVPQNMGEPFWEMVI